MGYEFFEEKIIFPSAPVPGINNDQSLTLSKVTFDKYAGVMFYYFVMYLKSPSNTLLNTCILFSAFSSKPAASDDAYS